MIGVYFSGTGNTKHCVRMLTKGLNENATVLPLEDEETVKEISNQDFIVFGYPIQYSNAPYFVREFITHNKRIWAGKRIFIVVTQGLFSGDGAGTTARLFKRYGGIVVGGLHIKMPDSVSDIKTLKRSTDDNKALIVNADWKINATIESIKNGKYPHEGLSFFAHMVGLFGQRLWFFGKTNKYSNQLKISDKCEGCGVCEKLCPLKNIKLKDGKAYSLNQCTMCYRCISHCPKQAITLVGKEVIEQVSFEKYYRD